MLIQCPHYGKPVVVNGLGRKAFNMPVIKVCDALRHAGNVSATAIQLSCSRAHIYKVLKATGLTAAEVIQGLATNDTNLLHNERLNDGR